MNTQTRTPDYEIHQEAASLLPLEYCTDRGVVLLGPARSEPGTPLTVGMLSPSDQPLIAELSQKLGRPIVPLHLSPSDLHRTIGRLYDLPMAGDEGGILALHAADHHGLSREQSPATLLETLLLEAVRRRATDLHLEVYARGVDLRLRVDGVLHKLPTVITHGSALRLVSRIKVLCGIDVAQHRHAQDGRLSVLLSQEGSGRRIDVRVSILPGPHGEDVAMRILDPERFILDLGRLQMPERILESYRRLTRIPHGLLLASGPTGAGKTTTLYATLSSLENDGLKIVSVEDPIEYEFSKINQKYVTPQMGFADHLRAFLRSNPDVIHVGEIRDPETAEIAVRAGTTGHRVLGTLHTRDAVSSIARLRALGVADDYLSEVLLGVLGQRLLRKLCDHCKKTGPVPAELRPLFFQEVPQGSFYFPAGCPECDGTGYRGLVGVFELFEPNEPLSQAIAEGVPVEILRKMALSNGWIPLVEDALQKAGSGLTSLEEVARRIPPKFRCGA